MLNFADQGKWFENIRKLIRTVFLQIFASFAGLMQILASFAGFVQIIARFVQIFARFVQIIATFLP
jgi:hypothetical protein